MRFETPLREEGEGGDNADVTARNNIDEVNTREHDANNDDDSWQGNDSSVDGGARFPTESYVTPDGSGRYGQQRQGPNQSFERDAPGSKRRQTQKNTNPYDKVFIWAAAGCMISSSVFPSALSYIPVNYRLTWGGANEPLYPHLNYVH